MNAAGIEVVVEAGGCGLGIEDVGTVPAWEALLVLSTVEETGIPIGFAQTLINTHDQEALTCRPSAIQCCAGRCSSTHVLYSR